MREKKENKGVTLLALVVTIVIMLILVGVGVYLFMPGGMIDRAVQAKFLTHYRAIEEKVAIYKVDKQIEEYTKKGNETKSSKLDKLPLGRKIEANEKEEIREKTPSLAEEIVGRNAGQSLDDVALYEIDKEKISEQGIKHTYIIDISSEVIYDYEGESFYSQRWHTIEGIRGEEGDVSDIYDGWIRLTLYYPDNSTEQKWMLKGEGEVREEDWKEYTGPIWVPVTRMQDIYIKYKLDNTTVIVPPSGKVGVVIEPEKYEIETGEKIKVKVEYSVGTQQQEYKIGSGSWQAYTGEFEVDKVGLIEARAKKTEDIYDGEGNKIATKEMWGKDSVYIRKKGEAIGGGSTGGAGDSVTGGSGSNEGGSGSGEPGEPGEPGAPGEIVKPGDRILPPQITVTPTTVTNQVTVSVTPPVIAKKVYIQIESGKIEEYTRPITIKNNTRVTAYYTDTKGNVSEKAYKIIDNIQQEGYPYVAIHANPYPYGNSRFVKEVEISITTKDANRVEYSTDGVIYQTYAGNFKVNQNGTIYARAIQDKKVATDALNITNIGKTEEPGNPTEPGNPGSPSNPTNPEKPNIQGKLAINIIARPDPVTSNKITDRVKIEIEYDKNATQKYYSIGVNGVQTAYTGEFEVTNNCVVYAYATGNNSKGVEYRVIDNITTGIIEPVINADPTNGLQASKVKIDIQYDKKASIKRYEIDGNGLRDYVGPIEVEKNCQIRAYNENSLGQSGESSYKVTNIMEPQPPIVIDQGDYYILKLNYPKGSGGREYKIKETGTWKGYKEDGILLVKREYKDKILNASGEVQVKIKNEKGQEVWWGGDVFVLNGPINEILEEISMRWDTVKPDAPQIVLNTDEPAKEVEVSMIYPKNSKGKEYKIIKPDGSTEGWKKYKEKFKIDQKNTVVMGRAQNQQEVWGNEAQKKITNIDEEQPVIKLTAELDKQVQELSVKVEVTDDTEVEEVRWAQGVRGESYFADGVGNTIANNSIVKINENGYYTFYAVDKVGNKQVYTINVLNIDLNAPTIQINVIPDDKIVLEAKAEINYGDSIKKEYKIGNGTTWTNYAGQITLNAYDIINKKLTNADKTVTIHARGTDSAGNVSNESKKVVNLDLDMPSTPVITSNYGYPILTSYGVKVDGRTTIEYDTRGDIDNYYSNDNGATWKLYEGEFQAKAGTVKAKSVKRATGLTVEASKPITVPADAVGPEAYDGNWDTYTNGNGITKKMEVDASMSGKRVRIKGYGLYGIAKTKRGESIVIVDHRYGNDAIYLIPEGTISLEISGDFVNEIQPATEPTFSATNGYMLLHADPTKAIKRPYQMVSISYMPTSVQRLYKIGNGEWKNYEDKAVWVNQGETIYAKGIDQYGNPTRITSSYTANVTDAIGAEAYDGNESTYYQPNRDGMMKIDASIRGKKMYYKIAQAGSLYTKNTVGEIVILAKGSSGLGTENTVVIPSYATELWVSYTQLYEIQPATEPTFSATNGYMLLHADPTKAIRKPYQMISISYFPTSVQRLYKIGNGTWQNYEDKAVWVNQGETIYAKGIDQYGNPTRITSSYTARVVDALGPEAYDGNWDTYTNGNGITKKMAVDASMSGKRVRIKGYGLYGIAKTKSGESIVIVDHRYGNDAIYLIPEGTISLEISGDFVNEIQPQP